ncbi:hypothetical protein SLEP1_g44143, partial [Rubroshorea leprosula]
MLPTPLQSHVAFNNTLGF